MRLNLHGKDLAEFPVSLPQLICACRDAERARGVRDGIIVWSRGWDTFWKRNKGGSLSIWVQRSPTDRPQPVIVDEVDA